MTSETTWVVVADGNAARFFVRAREGVPLTELTDLALTADAERRARGGDTAVHEGVNHGHQAHPAHENRQDSGERVFLRHIAGRLNLAVEEHAVGRLIICAPPRALGVIRDHVTAATRALVVAEIAKDLVREGVREIDERLKPSKV
ncbi:MAG: host attachment protein [Hyphomonadaceae bacterium]|nr:host attachment protein [Hyphomonadaceae bacterium]